MSQYCRYCAFCTNGDTYYCGEHDEVLTASYVKRANNCKDYALSELGDVDTGKQYKPRPRKKKTVEQMGWWRKLKKRKEE